MNPDGSFELANVLGGQILKQQDDQHELVHGGSSASATIRAT